MLFCKFSRTILGIALGAALFSLAADLPYASAADGQPAGRVVKKIRSRGRLPNHYADVVTEKQRDEIYKIQEEYKPKIDALKAQLNALNKEMKEKISAVLTADQKKKIQESEAAAKAKSSKDEKQAEPAKSTKKTEK